MSAFISHNQQDAAWFKTLRSGLEGQGVRVWNPESMEAGASLRDQLWDAITKCDVCVFLATQNSIQDAWCLAQMGAFWGAGKRVVVFKADHEVTEGQLPPQLQGNIWRDDFDFVVGDVKKIIFEAEERRRREAQSRPKLVAEMTIASLYEALVSLRSTALDSLPVGEAMRLIHENISLNLSDAEAMRPLIGRLVGVPQLVIEPLAAGFWPTPFRLATETDEWIGFAKKFTSYELTKEYSNCLLISCDDQKRCVAAIAASTVVERENKITFNGLIENAGGRALGTPRQLSARGDG